jgi:chemosensory pili system protein ChpA (sensor histidine kinase/response regulator)
MVGLTEFGDAAWAMEQVMNAWLAGSKPATPELCELCEDALQTLSQWVEDIAVHSAEHWQAAPFVQASEAMRERGERMLLVPPAAEAPASLSIETSPTVDQIDVTDVAADQLAAPEPGCLNLWLKSLT